MRSLAEPPPTLTSLAPWVRIGERRLHIRRMHGIYEATAIRVYKIGKGKRTRQGQRKDDARTRQGQGHRWQGQVSCLRQLRDEAKQGNQMGNRQQPLTAGSGLVLVSKATINGKREAPRPAALWSHLQMHAPPGKASAMLRCGGEQRRRAIEGSKVGMFRRRLAFGLV